LFGGCRITDRLVEYIASSVLLFTGSSGSPHLARMKTPADPADLLFVSRQPFSDARLLDVPLAP
jgi:hypothetical protein